MVHTIVICGEGQVLLVVVNVLPSEQDSIITQLVKLLHHPQSSIDVFDTDKHDEHPPAKAEQSYSITMIVNIHHTCTVWLASLTI